MIANIKLQWNSWPWWNRCLIVILSPAMVLLVLLLGFGALETQVIDALAEAAKKRRPRNGQEPRGIY